MTVIRMPRTPIDYSNTIIYKLRHKEDNENDNIYVGHTTDFTKRNIIISLVVVILKKKIVTLKNMCISVKMVGGICGK